MGQLNHLLGDEPMSAEVLAFGAFRLYPAQHALFEADKPVRVGSRALSILIALVEHAGELVTKEDLLSRVWPDTFVEEGNLRVHIAALRKVLGDGHSGARYIANVPGRGYRFLVPVSASPAVASDRQAGSLPSPARELPTSLVRMIGRVGAVQSLAAELRRHRFVTLVAPGGMGKTTVALALAERISGELEHGVRFVDLAPLSDPSLLPSAVAGALSAGSASATNPAQVRSFLADKQLLLVLDNCEQVLSGVAAFVPELLGAAPGLLVLATSREPLNCEFETVSRLPSLETPESSAALSASAALTFPAVQLFVERAQANFEAFELSDADAAFVAEICRWLDGNPLAIELAASQAAVLGVRQLALRLDSRFALTMKGRRTAAGRHQTLHATLDWSYGTLPLEQRAVLRRLAVFRGTFTLEAARAVAGARGQSHALEAPEVLDSMIALTAKSLMVADVSDNVRYRLLEVTRAYAKDRLAESGELTRSVRAHAEHLRDLFQRAEATLQARSADDWMAAHRFWIDDIRAALDWAFSAEGDNAIGVALTVSAIPLVFQTFLVEEYRVHLKTALERVRHASPPDPSGEMKLCVALGRSLLQARGVVPEVIELIEQGLALSEALPAPERMHALWAMWYIEMGRGRNTAAIELAQISGQIAAQLPDQSSTLYDRLMALPAFYLAQYSVCRFHAERVRRQAAADRRLTFTAVSHVQEHVSMQAMLACLLFVEGSPEEALETARQNLALALSLKHVTSHCHALTFAACPIALWAGRTEEARAYVSTLLAEATRHSLGFWIAWGRAYEWVLALDEDRQRGTAPRQAPPALSFGVLQADWLRTLSDGFIDADAVARAESGEIAWAEPEIARRRGMLLLKAGGPGSEQAAEQLFNQAHAQARAQGALAWELRSASELATLWLARGDAKAARELLSPLVARFPHGSQTADLERARLLLQQLE